MLNLALVVCWCFFVIIFVFVALLTQTIVRLDIVNLRGLVGGIGFITKPVNYFLTVIEKLIDFLKL